MLIMCQHVCCAVRMHLSGCACYATALERVCLSCASMCAVLREYFANALERVCLSCASMYAVLGECTSAGVLVMRQHVRSAMRMHLSGCVYHVPACVLCYANALERLCVSCASMCALQCECIERVCFSCASMCAVLREHT